MTDNQDPLQQLHPLRVPEPVSWWPPAIGWWLLAAALILLSAYLCYRLWRRYRQRAYRQRALAALTTLQKHDPALGTADFAAQVNALLKHCAIQGFGAREVAPLSGREWRDFLTRTLSLPSGNRFRFTEEIYSGRSPAQTIPEIAADARLWIRDHRVDS